MTDIPILRDLGFILLAAALFALAARMLRLPPIVGYMVAGLLLGPATHLVEATPSLELISDVGIALLLFLVGLELSLEKIRDVGRAAVVAGLGQILGTAVLGFALARVLGFPALPASLLALGVTFSSTVVAVKLLERQRDLDALHGRISVGILLVQDVAVAIALTLLAGLGEQTSLDLQTVGRGLLLASAGMVTLVLLAIAATRWILPPLFGWLRQSVEALFIWSITWCFGFILAAQALGLSVEIGAFVAGVSLAQLAHNEELVRRVHPLVNFFLAVFFVTLGVHMELGAALARWPAVLAVSAFVLVGKPIILMTLVPRLGYGERTSFLAALTLGQISEFSFIVVTLAMSAGLVGEDFLAFVGMVGLLTIGTSAVLIQRGDQLHRMLHDRGLLRIFRADGKEEEEAPRLEGHVIVVGMNTLGRLLVDGLVERGERVLAIDTDPEKLYGLPPCALMVANTEYPSALEDANLSKAKLLVSALQIEEANNLLAYQARRAGVPSSIHAFDPVLIRELRENGATHLMVSKHDGIRQVAEALRAAGIIN
jgi:Kef-type K+ transport system membrane component KefB